MMRNLGLFTIVASLVILAVFVLVYPHQMIAPGALIPAHANITNNCFACHSPFRGVASEKCVACHKLTDIGIRTTKGMPVPNGKSEIAFHRALSGQDCLACHSDHAEPRLTGQALKPFAQSLLQPSVQGKCASCHAAPKTAFHQSMIGGCAQCLTVAGWSPATFNHDRYFRLDGDHNAPCATCHVAGNCARHTCYGCHEHTPESIRAEHAEEGIRNIDNCVRCHRSSEG